TTGLDPLMAHAIHDLILAMHKTFGFTGIMVSHEIPEIFPISDWVAMLKNGKIIAMKPSDEFQRTSDPVVREFISVNNGIQLTPV
ncbi:MAG: ABC transporter ATP-binding protein, partial [Nitrospirota bacterium]|nr:ABC transporter ATP-binding protein [Nitrospirota bacterium]